MKLQDTYPAILDLHLHHSVLVKYFSVCVLWELSNSCILQPRNGNANMRAMWDTKQPMPVQGGGTDGGVLGVCSCGSRGVAIGSSRLLLQAHEGSPNHGSPCYCCLPIRLQCHSHLIMFHTCM